MQVSRESKGHRRCKLRALTDNLITRFTILEAEQHNESTSGLEAKGSMVQAAHRDIDEDRSTPITLVSSTPALSSQETTGEAWRRMAQGAGMRLSQCLCQVSP